MSILKFIKRKLTAFIRHTFRPKMISGYTRADGKFLPRVRMSNTVFIDHENKLGIEDNTYLSHFIYLECSNGITIETGCQIAQFVTITTHSSHNSLRLYGKEYMDHTGHIGLKKGTVFIGNHTFIGSNVVINPGTKIGKGSIVKAMSVLYGEYPDFSIIEGNPAKVVGNTTEKDNEFLEKNPELKNSYYRNQDTD